MNTLPHDASESNSPFIPIPLKDGRSILVDAQDADLASLKWFIDSKDYIQGSKSVDGHRRSERIHRIILTRKLGRPIADGMEADHANGNKLDNRRTNLREATPQQNLFNRGKNVHNASGYKGVRSNGNRWEASIIKNKKTMHLGVFDTPEEAAMVYDRAAIQVFGDYARTNFPDVPFELGSAIREDWTLRTNNKTGYRGVMRDGKKYRASIKYGGKSYYLGMYSIPEEAARAYDEAAKYRFGSKAKLNFP